MHRKFRHPATPQRIGADRYSIQVLDRSSVVHVIVDGAGLERIEAASPRGLMLALDHAKGRHRYVRLDVWTPAGFRRLTAARLVTGARTGQRVTYRDGDALNLTTANLKVSRGYAKSSAVRVTLETQGHHAARHRNR